MQALRRKLTKRPAKSTGSDKDGPMPQSLGAAEMSTVGPPPGGHQNVTIAGELSPTPSTSRHSRRLVRGGRSRNPTPPLNRRESFLLGMTHILSIFYDELNLRTTVDIDVATANSLFADREIALLTSPTPNSPPLAQQHPVSFSSSSSSSSPLPQTNVMSTPTHVIIPPTPVAVAAATFSEEEPAQSKAELPNPPLSSTPSPHPPQIRTPTATTSNEDPDDLWNQPPRRSSSLLGRFGRSATHRRSSSSPTDLRSTFTDSPPEVYREDEDDIVFIPEQLQQGMEMVRVSRKGFTKRIYRIDPINACVSWNSKKRKLPPAKNANSSIC